MGQMWGFRPPNSARIDPQIVLHINLGSKLVDTDIGCVCLLVIIFHGINPEKIHHQPWALTLPPSPTLTGRNAWRFGCRQAELVSAGDRANSWQSWERSRGNLYPKSLGLMTVVMGHIASLWRVTCAEAQSDSGW